MTAALDVPTRIETERLVMRPYVAADAEQLVEVVTRNLAHLRPYMEWIQFEPQSVADRREWIAGEAEKFAAGTGFTMGMFDKAGELVGGSGFHVRTDPDGLEIGYWIDAAHEGKGLVTEAAAALTFVALDIAGAAVVTIGHAPTNSRSGAVPRRLGYRQRDLGGKQCFDAGEMAPAVEWVADAATLTTEPLASWPRPALTESPRPTSR
ncbi:GNAT family N-acetyltransferase [Demequina sp. NBRC 110051]|uniref:GNAT family N-acetyltransferase n=1 Tax=Demequina sp. NBRC 110051 TaxID=1570340 RepID=UPI000A0200C0|nr:GNAT family N-acetyltransferase [Demequina sp. NBRC 110051]